ncbi:MAG: XRE family transcriptional regulator [Clostridiales bacterium]|uniref:helix-turn-helix transcriptional regulator n=1 Tax=Provencibacterium massiliense TaxID=1841868 RepID=UPI0009A5A601|nr:helix-turn-helix transcriptional regulator [Provencibacterium massiliense]PWM38740.1 MAG: XRE family transcriptional regulator [Clostridiales bacterium]RGB69000.1 XRE family transcriptional regulator [Harryflintia acetispora]
MEYTIGKKIAQYRKDKGLTQDELAELLGVSAQAVSKWENDLSCPDILLLPKLAELFDTTVDDLLHTAPKPETSLQPVEGRKNLDDMLFKVVVNTVAGDHVRVNLPLPLIKIALEMGTQIPQFAGSEALRSLDIGQLLLMVEKGVIGKLVEVEAANGDLVEIVVE